MAKAEYRSAIRSKKLIKAALADLLLEKPLDKITVTDIVNRAQINRGTFYAHYTDIPGVIDQLIRDAFSRIRAVISDQSRPLPELPRLLLQQIQTMLEEDLDFYRKIMNSGAAQVMSEQLINIVLEYLLQREADFGFRNHEQYVLTMRFCAGGLSNLYRDWFAGKLAFSLDELTCRAEELLSTSIQTALK